jgi:hypothetical protein
MADNSVQFKQFIKVLDNSYKANCTQALKKKKDQKEEHGNGH